MAKVRCADCINCAALKDTEEWVGMITRLYCPVGHKVIESVYDRIECDEYMFYD